MHHFVFVRAAEVEGFGQMRFVYPVSPVKIRDGSGYLENPGVATRPVDDNRSNFCEQGLHSLLVVELGEDEGVCLPAEKDRRGCDPDASSGRYAGVFHLYVFAGGR